MGAALVGMLLAPCTLLAGEIPVSEQPYSISGISGIELYRSIGEKGPPGAIAETRYKLTWKRLFDEEGGSCSLVRFRPEITISIVLPKPDGKLTPEMQVRWERFIKGIRLHEMEHVRMIRSMVSETTGAVQGARVQNDKTCAKVKKEVSRRIDSALATYKAQSREFDRSELTEGGNVHRLILDLVN